jgi:hypothetical protein
MDLIYIGAKTGTDATITNYRAINQADANAHSLFAGKVRFGGTTAPTEEVDITGDLAVSGNVYGNPASGGDLTLNSTSHATKGDIVSADNHIFNKSAVYDEEIANTSSSNATTIDWTAGNKQKYTNSENSTLTFTAPAGKCNLILKIVHAANATTFTVTWPASVKWAGGVAPTLTQTSGAIDIVSFYYDGTNYFGVANANFA